MNPGLYLVGTPIGNLADLSPRAQDTLRQADLILTEDTRHTAVLLRAFDIRRPVLSCHKFNEASRAQIVVSRLRAGAAVALVTDSGMPGVSDPGARMVRACRQEGLPVFVVPGPSAVTAAVAASGFGGAGFLFEGFLDHRHAARRRRLSELVATPVPVVLFESPHRVLRLLADMEESMAGRTVFLGRELTKKFEECLWGTPAELCRAFEVRSPRGEFVLVVAPEGLTWKGAGDSLRPA